jgi:hypothetical protein
MAVEVGANVDLAGIMGAGGAADLMFEGEGEAAGG